MLSLDAQITRMVIYIEGRRLRTSPRPQRCVIDVERMKNRMCLTSLLVLFEECAFHPIVLLV